MGDAMNPLNPNQLLRILENGYFMTHQEQADAAAYIRQLQQAVLDEREACAVLVEADGRVHPKAPDAVWAKTVAKLIRARGNHEQD
jgi:hypothetical protein